jgi:hypothetical protein
MLEGAILNDLRHTWSFVGRQIVHDDDIAFGERGASWVSTETSKAQRFIGPSSTQGALKP